VYETKEEGTSDLLSQALLKFALAAGTLAMADELTEQLCWQIHG
jgi:hypothetical protein